MISHTSQPSVAFITLGCAKNEVDSATMKRMLCAQGIALTDRIDEADAIVVNTCSFIQSATEESIDTILDVADLPRVREGTCALIVAGCLPARYGDDLAEELSEVRSFVPCAEEGSIVDTIKRALNERGCRPQTGGAADEASCATVDPGDGSQEDDVACGEWFDEELDPVGEQNGRAYSYVKISEGCDRFCSYCAIPFIRGRYYSFPYERIYAEVAHQVKEGVGEICLIAQDTGRWGEDFEPKCSLAWLVDNLAQAFPDTWFRIMYLQPEGVTDDLLGVMAAHDNVCPYFDIPLQHVNPAILAAMNRKGSRGEFERLFARIFAAIPHAVLRTTLIVGFPGETQEQFEELCAFVEDAPLDYVGLFPYSAEEGTRAAWLAGQCDEEEKQERAQYLRDLADNVCIARIAQRVGTAVEVLVEGREADGQLFGRTMQQAPDVDGVTFLYNGAIGEKIRTRIVDTLWYDMEGETDNDGACACP